MKPYPGENPWNTHQPWDIASTGRRQPWEIDRRGRSPSPGAISTQAGSTSSPQDGHSRSQSPPLADGMKMPPLEEGGALVPLGADVVLEKGSDIQGWYRAESNLVEQEAVAQRNFTELCKMVDTFYGQGICPSKRWTNDPDVFPDIGLGIVPFPPNNNQLYVPWPPVPPRPKTGMLGPEVSADDDICLGRPRKPDKDKLETIVALDPFMTEQLLTTDPKTGLPLTLKQQRIQEHEDLVASSPFEKATDDDSDIALKWTYGPPEGYGFRYPETPWVRLVDFSTCGGVPGVVSVFGDERLSNRRVSHLGRVYQGQLENAYLVEAMNAISLRPKLVRRLFFKFDIERSIYIVRLFKNGVWMRTEIDDYVPNPPMMRPELYTGGEKPFCCHSELFPFVLWPSLVEKAYAKICTVRGRRDPQYETGGWEALGNGGNVEEALADLTGGVAGCFSTKDVSADRLFIYFHELQRDCLWVCRVDPRGCRKMGVPLNPCDVHVFNRAAHYQGKCYVQIFTPGHCSGDGGLSQVVPDELRKMFPSSQTKDGFFWLTIEDFHQCFGTICECRLTNSPDVGIIGMPPSRLPNAYCQPIPPPVPWAPPVMMAAGGGMSWLPPGQQPLYFEWIYANGGDITEDNPPEFTVLLPNRRCEVVACCEQTDTRITQVGPERKRYSSILLKVYENVMGNGFSADMVCKSNWMPIRDAMIAFKAEQGGLFKIVAELPHDDPGCNRLIFRCYVSVIGSQVSAGTAGAKHLLVQPERPPLGLKWTLVGCVPPQKMAVLNMPVPHDFDFMEDDLDGIRRRRAAGEQCPVS